MTDLDSIKRDADIAELEFEIAEQRRKPLTYESSIRLACFYALRDRLIDEREEKPEPEPRIERVAAMNEQSEPMPDCELSRLTDGCDMRRVWSALDELLATIKAFCPRLYDGFVRKIDNMRGD